MVLFTKDMRCKSLDFKYILVIIIVMVIILITDTTNFSEDIKMQFLYIFGRNHRAFLLSLIFLAFTLHTSTATADGHSPHSVSANVTLTSDYVYRGVTQTNEDPALQGGFDYAHQSGFYLGVWASSIEFQSGAEVPANLDTAPDFGSMEIDIYGGMSGSFQNGIGWDIGALYYLYPDQDEDGGNDYDFVEFYGSLSYEWDHEYSPSADVGVAYSPDYFGEDDTGIWVHGGLGFSTPMVDPYIQVGYLDVDGDKTTAGGYDYLYYAVGVSKTIDKLTFDLSWQDASDYDSCGDGDDLCEAIVFSVSSSF